MITFLGFIDSATPVMEGIVDLHNHIFFYLVVILIFVVWIFSNIVYTFGIRHFLVKKEEGLVYAEFVSNLEKVRHVVHGSVIEIIWTIIPCCILVMIAIPSFALLYSMDEIGFASSITFKVVGHQWYWTYDFTDEYYRFMEYWFGFFGNSQPEGLVELKNYALAGAPKLFDSYMIDTNDLKEGYHRFLEVDRQIVLPTRVHVEVFVSAADVLHSWSVNALGVKIDAVPGRVNRTSFFIKRAGTYYGQCSEICGVNHGFMPIVIKAVPVSTYLTWLQSL
jgi:cytochrome c oxidase subunit 2